MLLFHCLYLDFVCGGGLLPPINLSHAHQIPTLSLSLSLQISQLLFPAFRRRIPTRHAVINHFQYLNMWNKMRPWGKEEDIIGFDYIYIWWVGLIDWFYLIPFHLSPIKGLITWHRIIKWWPLPQATPTKENPISNPLHLCFPSGLISKLISIFYQSPRESQIWLRQQTIITTSLI